MGTPTPISIPMQGGISQEVWGLQDFALKTRQLEALQAGIARYSIYRELRYAARISLEYLFDSLALHPKWTVQRFTSCSLLMESPEGMISASGVNDGAYCSVSFAIWTESVVMAESIRKLLLDQAGDKLIQEPMFTIHWHFMSHRGELSSTALEEIADDILYDSAYPDLKGGVLPFIRQFLSSEASILVLQGPPGTGKTRLIRGILGEISRAQNGNAHILYTGDKRALENDELFIKFLTGWEDAFVIEDADHLLMPRAQGNEILHRFLTIADGVVQSQGRKIIFSTNLQEIQDIDEALIRPGRCFARKAIRPLQRAEAKQLLSEMEAFETILKLESMQKDQFTLAEIYQLVGQ